ncbi:recombination protein U [Streptococcus sanguinis SK1 = NCTC 7863]|jgi:recombination protein U|uniref:Holliday junction resolvase RecU n=1 Tax=Streptococcus sanguinis TaxID=1305 RepID=A0ABD7JSD1_STRSA|nr:Holliday junction resolvase RecU [Streptococcus sanguinis]PLA64040.1 Holliday junction resolvase RecU [Streptococcus salivarius]EGC25998.1 recombination protein U [Streptococcus sanguinis SK678]EGF05637.1 recombination protein U [Streptococcus sanguinis SK1 = NCTC 7863]EGF22289.1 recombination protein U [Streptococcus sanguinis SK1058]ETD05938.1 Holliday junction resolvase recU [Streptococcus sanguinis CC94A]
MVNYPHKLKAKSSINRPVPGMINFANRGMSFEKMINESNSYYLSRGLAVIHKKPTPIQIVKVDYPHRSRAKIVEAYFRQASTTDYSGVYKGHYIDFEAKETRQKKSMPMKNFHSHQIEHMEAVLEQKGICFVLLHFSSLRETYLLPASYLIEFYKIDKGGRSMPLTYIQEHGYPIEMQQLPSIPYLEIIEQKLLGGIINE